MDDSLTWHTEQVRRLTETLVLPADPAACDGCVDALEAYVAAQLAGTDYVAAFPAVARHLDACVACAETYAALYRSFQAYPEPAQIPAADLGFLKMRRSLSEMLRAAIHTLGDQVQITFSNPLLAVASARPAAALRTGNAPLMEFQFQAAENRLDHVVVQVYPEQASTCTVRVQVTMADREWPDLLAIPVRLLLPTFSYAGETDAWGEVVFDAVVRDQLDSLTLEIDLPAPISS